MLTKKTNTNRDRKWIAKVAVSALVILFISTLGLAQQTTGRIRGVVKDPNGAVVAGASVVLTNTETNISQTVQSSSEGEYQFNDLLVGTYKIVVTATGFKTLTLNDVRVVLNNTTDVPTGLTVGGANDVIEVSAGGAELVSTTTTTLNKDFNSRQAQDLAQTSAGAFSAAGINNLALIAPNVTSSGGVGVGTGGSVGGQRPRNNNFVIDGIDNNDKAVTGPQVYVTPDAVSEFSLLSNQFSAEFAHSTGGQFITVTKTGTNEFHGSAYYFFRNRHLNAMDSLIKTSVANATRADNPRFDYGRFGGNVSGPIIKDKLFFFGSYERVQQGSAFSSPFFAPTAAGFATLSGLAGLSQTNLGVLKQFVPAAPTQCTDDSGAPCVLSVNGTPIPFGSENLPAPNFLVNHNVIANVDFNQNDKTQHRFRFTLNNNPQIDNAATFAAFFTTLPIHTRLTSYTMLHTFSPNVSNELRLGYRRLSQNFTVPNIQFPGLDQFPNITVDELSFNIGPNPNAPQFNFENNYQIVDNVSWLHGPHSFKFGGDFRILISPQSFVQRQRGDYEYAHLQDFLNDISGNFAERSVGASPYYGNQKLFFAFAQDDWRIRDNVTLNLGINYSLQQLPLTARQQDINSIASVPGLIDFREPKMQGSNFAPRFGIAYAPNFTDGWMHKIFGDKNQSSIRAGFSMAYDVIFDNLYILALPPQFNQTVDVQPGVPNFLKNGGIPPTPVAVTNDPAAARAATAAFIPDQKVPYSLTYTLSYQREFAKNYSVELRYLGTRGVHLLTQNRINEQSVVTPSHSLPTFFSTPTAAQVSGLTLTRGQLVNEFNNGGFLVPEFANAGFDQNFITSFPSNGNSSYNAFSAQLTRRFTAGWVGSASYTWSHLIDDTTAEVFSTVLSPRRVQDPRNLQPERADSALDHRHRFVLTSVYDLPFFAHDSNSIKRVALGGWSVSGTWSIESGEKATIRSGIDSNLNGDNAGDRTIINPGGAIGTSTAVSQGVNSAGVVIPLLLPNGKANPDAANIVAYVANSANAQYVQAQLGALATAGRNTLSLPRINNVDFSLFKNFKITENKTLQYRVDMYNIFNHAQYVPGSVNTVNPIANTGSLVTNSLIAGSSIFNQPSLVFSNNPRVVQMALRFTF